MRLAIAIAILSAPCIFGQQTVVADGDSITKGYGIYYTPDTFPSCRTTQTNGSGVTCVDYLSQLLGMSTLSAWTIKNNFGQNGATIPNIISAYPGLVHPISPAVTAIPGILLVWIGANDICGSSAATIEANLTAYWAGAKADGWRVGAFTIIPRAACGEATRAAVNTWIRANRNLYDWLIDTASVLPDQTNATLFQGDQVHPTVAGDTAAATLANQVLAPRGLWPLPGPVGR